jgi:hypothetical protein
MGRTECLRAVCGKIQGERQSGQGRHVHLNLETLCPVRKIEQSERRPVQALKREANGE